MARSKSFALHWQILIGLVLGIIVGAALNIFWKPGVWESLGVRDVAQFFDHRWEPTLPPGVEEVSDLPADERLAVDPNYEAGFVAKVARTIVNANSFVGDMFLRLLRFIAAPIVLFSLIVGVASLNDLRKLSRIGGKSIAIYLCTTAIAITIGLTLANVIRPGKFVPADVRDQLQAQQEAKASASIATAQEPSIWQVFLDFVPTNPFKALAEGEMLQIVTLSLLIGIGITLIPKGKSDIAVRFFDAMTEAVIKLVQLIMLIAPLAVFALIAKVASTLGLDVLKALIVYCTVVVVGLALHMFGVYPLIFLIFTKMGYARFFKGMAPAQLLAFSTSSSSATLPVTIECARDRLGVREDVSSFVLPLGATVNMDGTALYQGVAAVFIAQMYNMGLSLADQLTIVLTATLASIGTAGVPGVGIIMLVIVLRAVHVPLEGIAVILGVDRLLDMCRTCVNVTGDAAVAVTVASTEGALLTAAEVEERARLHGTAGLDENPPDDEPPHGMTGGSTRSPTTTPPDGPSHPPR